MNINGMEGVDGDVTEGKQEINKKTTTTERLGEYYKAIIL